MAIVDFQNVTKQYGTDHKVIENFQLAIEPQEFIVFLGPSGSGKSTTLRMLAGLEEVTAGKIMIRGKDQTHASAKERELAIVFQNYALYPHMTVEQNLSFGLRMRKTAKTVIDQRIGRAAEILELTPYLKKYPGSLSGGQMQRVALGRAIVRESDIFLMDEPLSNLDAKLRGVMREEIVKLHRRLGATTIYVTHDQAEAMTMATRIVVMNQGAIQQIGTPKEIFSRPANLFVAAFIGNPAMNLIPLDRRQGRLSLDRVLLPIESSEELILGIRPENILVEEEGEFSLQIEYIEDLGNHQYLHGTIQKTKLVVADKEKRPRMVGETIKIRFKQTAALFYRKEDGQLEEGIRWL